MAAIVERAVVFTTCPDCAGTRLSEAARSSKIKGVNIAEACAMQITDLAEWVGALADDKRRGPGVAPLLATLRHTLDSFVGIGLGYLSLARPAGTLSGGEAQRVKLATELSKRSTGRTLYILDEPTTGLHKDDVRQLLGVLNRLVEAGGGTVVKTDRWGRRRFAYEINHKPEGIYAVINVTATVASVKELDRQLSLNEAVLRTKVLRADEPVAAGAQ